MKKEIKLWKIAKKKILHGNMLLSKRPEMHLPNIWPTYYLKAKGVNVWGLDKKIYRYAFLVGPNTLGYANSRIDNEVIKTIKKEICQPLTALKKCCSQKFLSQYIHGPTM